jgi:arginyl-tRNA synthetase
MLRFTRNTVIAFDFKDALNFEGETGPYIQYAIVRAANIFRKAGTTERAALAAIADLDLSLLAGEDGTSLWETWLLASRLTTLIEQAIATAEPAYLARYAFQLAQQFNNFYHRHHILTEQDPNRRAVFLATAAVARREMVRALGYLGIESGQTFRGQARPRSRNQGFHGAANVTDGIRLRNRPYFRSLRLHTIETSSRIAVVRERHFE